MAEVTLAGLVEEGLSGMGCMAGDLLPGEVLAVDASAAEVAPLDTGLATLDPGHLGDLGQSPGLEGRAAAHPGGRRAQGGWDGSRFGSPVAGDGIT